MLYQLQYPADLKSFKPEFLFINFDSEFKGSIASKYLSIGVFCSIISVYLGQKNQDILPLS